MEKKGVMKEGLGIEFVEEEDECNDYVKVEGKSKSDVDWEIKKKIWD
jgi:hypothetical protein